MSEAQCVDGGCPQRANWNPSNPLFVNSTTTVLRIYNFFALTAPKQLGERSEGMSSSGWWLPARIPLIAASNNFEQASDSDLVMVVIKHWQLRLHALALSNRHHRFRRPA